MAYTIYLLSDKHEELIKRVRNNDTDVTRIEVYNIDIGNRGPQKFAKALKTNTSVRSITFHNTSIGDAGAKALAELLETNTTLTDIELSRNKIGDEGAKALAEALKTNTNIKLTSIELDENKIGDEGAVELAEALKTNKTLTSIKLGKNNIGDDGAVELAEALKTNATLTSIELNNNSIGDEGVKALAEALKTNTTLTSIDLFRNDMGYEGAEALVEALKTNTALTYIWLNWKHLNPKYENTITDLTTRNMVFSHHKAMIDNNAENFYINANKNEYKWSSGNLCTALQNSEHIREAPVWETALGDGKVFELLLGVLRSQFNRDVNGSEKKKLKTLVETKKNSKGSSLLHLAADKVIPEALELCKFLVEEIGVDFDQYLKDSVRRTAKVIAKASTNTNMSDWAKTVGTFLGFDLEKVLHVSNTAIVLAATNSDDSKKLPKLPNGIVLKAMTNLKQVLSELEDSEHSNGFVLKAMNNPEQVLSELNGRLCLGNKRRDYIVDVLRLYVDKSECEKNGINLTELEKVAKKLEIDMVVSEDFTKELVLQVEKKQPDWKSDRFRDYNFILVLERAAYTLSDAIMHHDIAGKDFPEIRKIAIDIAKALDHLHENEFIHADLKPLNIVRVGGKWQLIDMDISCEIGKGFGLKEPSSGYCPPEMAKVLRDSKMELNHYIANPAFDLWSFGVVLYHLVIGEPLWKLKNDDCVGEDDLEKLENWNEKKLLRLLNKSYLIEDQKVALNLIGELLKVDVNKRNNNFPVISEVCEHPFLKAKDRNSDVLKKVVKKVDKILDNQIQLKTMGEGIGTQLQRMQNVLLTGIYEATEVTIPTSCIILPHKLGDSNDSLPKDIEKFFIEEGEEEDNPSTSKIGAMKEWFNRVVKVGDKMQDGEYLAAGVEAAQIAIGLTNKKFYLYLIDEVTGEPVISDKPNYPIKITQPDKWLQQLMPVMKTGLKVMSVTKGLFKVAQCFFPPLLLASEFTSIIHKKTKTVVGALDQESSIAEYDGLSATLKEAEGKDSGAKNEQQRGAALRAFEKFLKVHKVVDDYFGLEKKVIRDGDRAGTAVWTSLKDEKSIQEALNKTTEERKRERRIDDIERRIVDLREEVTYFEKKLRTPIGNRNNDEKRKTMICIRNKKIDSLQKEMDELKAAVGNI